MLNTYDKQEIGKAMKIIWVLWGMVFSTLVVYLLICYVVNPKSINPNLEYYKYFFYGISAVIIFISAPIKKFLLQPKYIDSVSIGEALAIQYPPLAWYSVVVIGIAVLLECIGIFGLVLNLMGAEEWISYVFLTISGVMFIYHRPKIAEVDRLANEWTQLNFSDKQ